MENKFRYHPIVEGLKVNEDGSVIMINDREVRQYPIKGTESRIVKIKNKTVSVAKLICETWNGFADSPEYVASKIDENGTMHYTNLEWRKRGQGTSHSRSNNFNRKFKFPTRKSLTEFIDSKPSSLNMKEFLKVNKISESAFYGAKKRFNI